MNIYQFIIILFLIINWTLIGYLACKCLNNHARTAIKILSSIPILLFPHQSQGLSFVGISAIEDKLQDVSHLWWKYLTYYDHIKLQWHLIDVINQLINYTNYILNYVVNYYNDIIIIIIIIIYNYIEILQWINVYNWRALLEWS